MFMHKYELYHFMGRTKDRKNFKENMKSLWNNHTSSLSPNPLTINLRVHTFVLMPNHFHLLAESPIDHPKLYGQNQLDIAFAKISNTKVYRETYCYITMNPVRAQLCRRPEHYPYSTLFYQAKQKYLPFQLYSRLSLGLGGTEGELAWISRSYSLRSL